MLQIDYSLDVKLMGDVTGYRSGAHSWFFGLTDFREAYEELLHETV